MQREELRQATRAPYSSSTKVWSYVPLGVDRGGHGAAAGREFGGAVELGVALVQEAVGFLGQSFGTG